MSNSNTAATIDRPPIDLSVPVLIYADGSCLGNPGPGGWGAYLLRGASELDISGPSDGDTTNNRMELLAVIEALAILRAGSVVEVRTDSAYVQKGITAWIHQWRARGWRTSGGGSVKNADLWVALDRQQARHTVTWTWVEGHTGEPGNERADTLAKKAAEMAAWRASKTGTAAAPKDPAEATTRVRATQGKAPTAKIASEHRQATAEDTPPWV